MQVVMAQGGEQQQQQHAKLGEGCLKELLALAGALVQAACGSAVAAISSGGSSNANPDTTTSTTTTNNSSRSSSVGGGGGSGGNGSWSLAASLAAAVAAGALSAHLPSEVTAAAPDGVQLHDRAPAGEMPQADDSSGGTSACGAGAPTSSDATGGAEGTGSMATGSTGCSPCPANCSICCSASHMLVNLYCLERGHVLPTSQISAVSGHTVLVKAAQQRGVTLQQLLQEQLLALAARHPVPGVCSNVLCGRLEGPSAVGAVWGCVGTRCGRCRAAWYCCERCQQAAWPVHRLVCRALCNGRVDQLS
jgi:hypothetical protein